MAVLMALLQGVLSGQEPLLAEFQEKWQNARAYTLELAESMPADSYAFAPTEDQMSFSAQLTHIVRNMAWLSHSYLGGPRLALGAEPLTEKSACLALLKEGFDSTATAVAQLDPATLDEQVDFFAGPKTRRQILILLNDHLTHHRGQLIVYLRLQGIKPPRYRGW